MYVQFYNHIYSGYQHVIKCIESCETDSQLQSCNNLVNNWVSLVDAYCGRLKRKDARVLGEASQCMLTEIVNTFKQTNDYINKSSYEEYEGNFGPVRIKSIQEWSE